VCVGLHGPELPHSRNFVKTQRDRLGYTTAERRWTHIGTTEHTEGRYF